jgi:hypothetical protein
VCEERRVPSLDPETEDQDQSFSPQRDPEVLYNARCTDQRSVT